MKKYLLVLFIVISALNSAAQTIVTGTPAHTSSLPGVPPSSNVFFNQTTAYKKFQFIYSNSELVAFTTPITASVPITQIWLRHVGSGAASTTLSNFKISIGHSNNSQNALDPTFANNFSTAPVVCLSSSSFTYSVPVTPTTGIWIGIALSTPFQYDGVSNLCIQYEYTASTAVVSTINTSISAQTLSAATVTATTGAITANRPQMALGAGPPCNVPNFKLGPDTFYCSTNLANTNTSVQLGPTAVIAPTTPVTTYQWTATTIPPANPGPITGIPTATLQTTTPPQPGTYILTATQGLCKRRDTIVLRPYVPTFKLLSKDTSLCLGQTSLSIPVPTNVNQTPTYSFSWYKYTVGAYAAGTVASTANTVTASAPPTGLPQGQYYTLSVTNGSCTRKDSIKVRFGGISPVFSLIQDTFYCGTANNVQIKPLSQIIPPLTNPATTYTYQWTGTTVPPAVPGNITGIPTASVQTTTPTQAGQYVLTVSNLLNGCKYSDTCVLRNRRINPLVFPKPDTSGCDPSITSITLTAPNITGTNLGNPYTYSWFSQPFAPPLGGTVVSTTNTAIAPNTSPDQNYILTVSNGFCTTLDTIRVRFGTPTPFTLIKDTFFCAPANNVTLSVATVLPPAAPLTSIYQWTGKTLTAPFTAIPAGPISTNGQSATPGAQGSFVLTYTNAFGCKSRDTVELRNRRVGAVKFTKKDTSLCGGQGTFVINAPTPATPNLGNPYTYQWITYPTGTISTMGTQISTTNSTIAPSNLLDNQYLVIINNGFCENRDSMRVRFGQPTPFELGNDTFFCKTPNTMVQLEPNFSPNPQPNGLNFLWSASIGTLSPNNQIGAMPTMATGITSKIKLTITNAAGCKSADSLLLTNRSLPTVSLGANKLICNKRDSAVKINAPTNAAKPQTWSWLQIKLPSGPTSLLDDTSAKFITVTQMADYVFSYTNNFCTNTDTIRVTYADSSRLNLGADTFFCNLPTDLKIKIKPPYSALHPTGYPTKAPWIYSWTGLNGTTGIPLTPAANGSNTNTVTPPNIGTYTLTMTNDSGCKSVDRIIVRNYKVSQQSQTNPVLIQSTSNNPRDTILCVATSYPLKGNVLPPNTAPYTWTYEWHKSPNVTGTPLSTTQNYTPTAAGSGSGTYYLYIDNGFCRDSDQYIIVFSQNPTFSLPPDDTLCEPFNVTVNAPVSTNPQETYTYQWTSGAINLGTNDSIIVNNAATYNLQVSNQYGCKSQDAITISSRKITPFTLANDTGVCNPATITLSGPASLVGPNIYSYQWTRSPGNTIVGNSQTLPPIGGSTSTGTYVLTVKNGPCVRKDSINLEFLSVPVVQLPSDQDFCGKNQYSFTAQPTQIFSGLIYSWSNGVVGPVNVITSDGTYIIKASNKYCSTTDNITITSKEKPILNSLGPDKQFCANENINLFFDPIVNNNNTSPFTVQWLPGNQTTPTLTVTAAGTYIIKVKSGLNCEASDTVKITTIAKPNLNIPDSLFICSKGSYVVNASCNAQSYSWNTGSTDSIITITDGGYYTVEASNGRCKSSDRLFVDKLNKIDLGEDIQFCPDFETPTLEIDNKQDAFTWANLTNPNWLDKDKKRKLLLTKAGTYVAYVSRKNCTVSDTVKVETYQPETVFVPNSYSPNKVDNINDAYKIKIKEVKDFNIKIFTRFGEVLFESSDPDFEWKGTNKKGERIMSGAYVYSISYRTYCTGEELFRDNGILNVF